MSARIIKAHSIRDAARAEVFNFVDMQRQGDDLISAARSESEQILAAARNEAVEIHEQALAEARAVSRDEAFRDADAMIARQANELAEQRLSEQLATALPALQAAAEALQGERDRWLIRWEQTAVRLGVAIAEKLIQRQLTSRPEISGDMVANALRLAAGQPQLTVHLHPDDLTAWGDRAPEIVQSLTACADSKLVADRQVSRGGCRIETRYGEIDARIETMLRRIAEELLDE